MFFFSKVLLILFHHIWKFISKHFIETHLAFQFQTILLSIVNFHMPAVYIHFMWYFHFPKYVSNTFEIIFILNLVYQCTKVQFVVLRAFSNFEPQSELLHKVAGFWKVWVTSDKEGHHSEVISRVCTECILLEEAHSFFRYVLDMSSMHLLLKLGTWRLFFCKTFGWWVAVVCNSGNTTEKCHFILKFFLFQTFCLSMVHKLNVYV